MECPSVESFSFKKPESSFEIVHLRAVEIVLMYNSVFKDNFGWKTVVQATPRTRAILQKLFPVARKNQLIKQIEENTHSLCGACAVKCASVCIHDMHFIDPSDCFRFIHCKEPKMVSIRPLQHPEQEKFHLKRY